MEKEHEIRVSEIMKDKGCCMTSRAEGYYSEKEYKRQNLKEYESCLRSGYEALTYAESFDMLRFIALVIPEIKDPKDKIIVEKYLMGFSVREICAIVGFLSTSSVHGRLKKYMDFLKEKLEDAIALKESFENKKYEYTEPCEGIKVEKEIADARLFLENVFGFETFIYPFDISAYSYKITAKHEDYGTKKFSCDGFLAFVKALKEKLKPD